MYFLLCTHLRTCFTTSAKTSSCVRLYSTASMMYHCVEHITAAEPLGGTKLFSSLTYKNGTSSISKTSACFFRGLFITTFYNYVVMHNPTPYNCRSPLLLLQTATSFANTCFRSNLLHPCKNYTKLLILLILRLQGIHLKHWQLRRRLICASRLCTLDVHSDLERLCSLPFAQSADCGFSNAKLCSQSVLRKAKASLEYVTLAHRVQAEVVSVK